MQPALQSQPSPKHDQYKLIDQEPPSTAIPPSGGRPPPRQCSYKLPVCKDLILPPPPPKPPNMSIDTIIPAYQLMRIEDELVDVDAIEPDLNKYIKENIHEV